MAEKLLTCPFCGGEAEVTKGYQVLHRLGKNGYCVECYSCDLQYGNDIDYGGIYFSKEDAIEAWNRRGVNDRETKGRREI